MIRIRRGTVRAVVPQDHVVELTVDIGGVDQPAIAYPGMTAPITKGDVVILNTTAVELGLGTGGVHFVIAVEGKEADAPARAAMKLRYSPVQSSVDVVEERFREQIDATGSLDGMPVVVAGLHSALAPALIGARSVSPTLRIAYVMTDGAALHLGFSRLVPSLRKHGLLDVTFTAGQALGGDHEAVTLHGALVAARAVERADVAVVAMGPGNLGSGSRWGFALLETAGVIDAADALGARALVVPRISFTDARERHRGVSHHTVTALRVARARATVVLPTLEPERREIVREALATLDHDIVEVDLGDAESELRDSPVPLSSMGRNFEDDPDHFRAGAAAGVLAGRAATSMR